jgi:UDP:flavonoid glycosyltransferase YjiC (YdhE family)
MLATGARAALSDVPANVRVSDYLPGEAACARSALVVCNGGSPTAHQSLAVGVPVLGLPTNMDQYLAMRYVELAGAGVHLRGGMATAEQIEGTIRRLLADASYRQSAKAVAADFERFSAPERFAALLAHWC